MIGVLGWDGKGMAGRGNGERGDQNGCEHG